MVSNIFRLPLILLKALSQYGCSSGMSFMPNEKNYPKWYLSHLKPHQSSICLNGMHPQLCQTSMTIFSNQELR